MIEIVKSPLAENDLIGIWQYSYEKWGSNKAGEYLLQLDSGMQELTNNPLLGKSREIVRPSYRIIKVSLSSTHTNSHSKALQHFVCAPTKNGTSTTISAQPIHL